MKVLMITGHDVWGSLAEFSPLKNILLALGAKGHQVVLVTNDKVGDKPTKIFGKPVEYFHPNVEVIRFHIPGDNHLPWIRKIPVLRSIWDRIRTEFLFPIQALWHSRRWAKKNKPDLVYGYEIFASIPAYLMSKRLGRKLLLRYQGTLLSFLAYEAKSSFKAKVKLARHYFHAIALKVPADLIVMTDDGTQGESMLRQLGNTSPVKFWRNGLDVGRQEKDIPPRQQLRDELNLPQDAKVLLSVNRLTRWKRADRIINALPIMAREIPNFFYVIVGDGECMQEYQARVQQLGVQEYVRFVGRTVHDVIVKYMHASDCFIITNDWSNAGNPTMEAMMCGMPIVTYDVGDTYQLIQDRVNGRLLKTDDAACLADAVVELMKDDSLRSEFGRKAGEFARAKLWTWQERMDAEIAELERLAAEQR